MDTKENVITIGGHGMVGSRVSYVLNSKFNITDFSRSLGVDITNPETLLKIHSSGDWVILYAAKVNVDACEEEKQLGVESEAWKINVEGTKNVINFCKEKNKKLLYISTDFVFDGNEGSYSEDSQTHPINFYGETKAKAEEAIVSSDIHWIIVRISFPFTFINGSKHFIAALYNRLVNNQSVQAVTDELFSPTWIDDLAHAIDELVSTNEQGVFHVGGISVMSPFDIAQKLAEFFALDVHLISKTTREHFFAGKAPRPFNTSLKSDKMKKLGVELTSFEEVLKEIKEEKKMDVR